jgi:type VI secretion system protein ImpA
MFDLEGLLQPVSDAEPSGPDLSGDRRYAEFELARTGKPERQAGETILPAEPPDWKDVLERSRALFAASKDLRVAVTMTRALLETDGFPGLADGFALVSGLVERHWEGFHPRLDAEDDNDPTERLSAMKELTDLKMIQAVREGPLVVSRSFGRISLRTIQGAAAAAVARPPAAKPGPAPTTASAAPPTPNATSIEAAFREAAKDTPDALATTAAALTRCLEGLKALAAQWEKRLPSTGGSGITVNFAELRGVLAQALQPLAARVAVRAPGEDAGPSADLAQPHAAAIPSAAPFRRDVASRDDVLRAIDAICAYYEAHEPSSPVPLLLLRGKRFVTMSFLEILKEMVPESIANVQKITGKTDA